MQKLYNSIIHKMIEKRLSAAQIDFILYISRFQNDYGKITGVYYRDICAALNISYQHFYNILDSLQACDMIRAEKASYFDWDITIIDNEWPAETMELNIKKGYLNTNHNIFFTEEWKQLKANEKLMAMELMVCTYTAKASFIIGLRNMYKKYSAMFRVTERVIRSYLSSLKQFFSIGRKEHKYYFTPRKVTYRNENQKSEADNYIENQMKAISRRCRVVWNKRSEFLDTARLIRQYREINNNIEQILEDLITSMYAGLAKEDRILQPKYIHKMLRQTLGINNRI